jgi:hypothetical protein
MMHAAASLSVRRCPSAVGLDRRSGETNASANAIGRAAAIRSQKYERSGASSLHIGVSRGRRMESSSRLALVSRRQHFHWGVTVVRCLNRLGTGSKKTKPLSKNDMPKTTREVPNALI